MKFYFSLFLGESKWNFDGLILFFKVFGLNWIEKFYFLWFDLKIKCHRGLLKFNKYLDGTYEFYYFQFGENFSFISLLKVL